MGFSDTIPFDKDLLVNDNFSVVSSGKLLAVEFMVDWGCFCTVAVVKLELSSDNVSTFIGVDSMSSNRSKLLVGVLSNEIIWKSKGWQKAAEKFCYYFIIYNISSRKIFFFSLSKNSNSIHYKNDVAC